MIYILSKLLLIEFVFRLKKTRINKNRNLLPPFSIWNILYSIQNNSDNLFQLNISFCNKLDLL